MLDRFLYRLKSKWIVGLFVCYALCSAGQSGAECGGWPDTGPMIDSASGYWEIEYDLTGSEFETRNTPLGAGDTTHVVGPGTMTIRFESDGAGSSGSILDGGDAQIVQLDLTQEFALRTRVLGFRANVTTQINSAIPDNRWDGNAAGRVSLGSSRGTINGETLIVAAPGMRSYHTLGSVLCEGNGCRFGSMPPGVTTTVDNDFDVIALNALRFGMGGPLAGAGFVSNEIALPTTDRAEPYLRLLGREVQRVFVPPPSTDTAFVPRACYSVLDYGAQSAEAFTGGP